MITLHTLNLHNVICQLYQLYISKAGRKKEKIVSLNDTHNLQQKTRVRYSRLIQKDKQNKEKTGQEEIGQEKNKEEMGQQQASYCEQKENHTKKIKKHAYD